MNRLLRKVQVAAHIAQSTVEVEVFFFFNVTVLCGWILLLRNGQLDFVEKKSSCEENQVFFVLLRKGMMLPE